MTRSARCAALAITLVLLAPFQASAGEMTSLLKIDAEHPRTLQTRFGTYGYRSQPAIFPEVEAIRFYLPAGVAGITQTGVYSKFALAGDCEVVFHYELLAVQPPQSGYGAGLGVAFDVGQRNDRGDMQRVYRIGGASGYALHGGDPEKKQVEKGFVPTEARSGRMGLRRIKNELIFLASEEGAELQEIARLPFTNQTIRSVRLFADAGGSPTAVDVRLSQIEMRGEEITGGVAKKDVPKGTGWWLWLVLPIGGGALFWLWRTQRQR